MATSIEMDRVSRPFGAQPIATLGGGPAQLVTKATLDSLIYIADDQPANVALLRAVLDRAGYTSVVAFDDGSSLLAGIAEREPDLILLDLQMPVVDAG